MQNLSQLITEIKNSPSNNNLPTFPFFSNKCNKEQPITGDTFLPSNIPNWNSNPPILVLPKWLVPPNPHISFNQCKFLCSSRIIMSDPSSTPPNRTSHLSIKNSWLEGTSPLKNSKPQVQKLPKLSNLSINHLMSNLFIPSNLILSKIMIISLNQFCLVFVRLLDYQN